MNREHPSLEQLQRYFDGELAADERARAEIEERIVGCPECTAQLDGFARLRRLVNVASDDAIASADFSGLFARIEAQLEPQLAEPVRLDAHVRKPAAVRAGPTRRMRTLYRAAPALGAVALAAAAMLMVYRPDSNQGDDDTSYDDGYDASARSEVEEIDMGKNAGTVFNIELKDGTSNAVIWLADPDDDDDSNDEGEE
jgi:hypothetical protein